MSFLTVEDYNSILKGYGASSIFYTLDTSLIDVDTDYSGVEYDFVIVSRSKNGANYTFTFNVVNALWGGGFWFTKTNGDYINSGTLNQDGIMITTTEENIQLHLYLHNLITHFYVEGEITWYPKLTSGGDEAKLRNIIDFENKNPSTDYLGSNTIIVVEDLTGSLTGTQYLKFTDEDGNVETVELNGGLSCLMPTGLKGVITVTLQNASKLEEYYYEFSAPKSITPIRLNNTELYIGKINKISFHEYAGNYWQINSGILIYDGVETEVTLNNNSTIDLDLREKSNLHPVRFKIVSNTVNGDYDYEYNFVLPCKYLQISSVSDLVEECDIGGASVIELSDDLQLSSNIPIKHNIKIIGNNNDIDLNNYSLILNEGVEVILENINFDNGNPAIIQKKNTKLEIKNSTFTHCKSTNYNNLGACIYCKTDSEGLNTNDDFTTIITGTYFHNNHSAIFHGGNLTVNNCRYHNTDLTYANQYNVGFLYQTDGNARIYENIFDIDYTAETLCTSQKNIGFAQALIHCGNNAQINGARADELKGDNCLPFNNNSSHIFVKYYYPQISACVYTSPILNYEDKAVCYSVGTDNWVYKQNVQVTRASWETENRNRKIMWED